MIESVPAKKTLNETSDIKLSDICFALHNFPTSLKEQYITMAKNLCFKKQVAVPTRLNKEAENQNVIVISYDIQEYKMP
jgi:hypothetical protein